jgi:hypothetical protein
MILPISAFQVARITGVADKFPFSKEIGGNIRERFKFSCLAWIIREM